MNYSYPLFELAQLFLGTLAGPLSRREFNRVCIDSRNVRPGDLFFCIKGERTDGHLYVAQAIKAGAGAIVACSGRLQRAEWEVPVIWVEDPNQCLLTLSHDYRNRTGSTRVVGITGSNGKTSTKEIALNLCRFLDPRSHGTQGNFNNFIGVPLTVLSADLSVDWWIVEMGTNHFGEIATLSKTVAPDAGILTNIGESHLEFLLSTEGVAREKSGLFAGMKPGSICAIPEDILHKGILYEQAQAHGVHLLECGLSLSPHADTIAYPATVLEQSAQSTVFRFCGQRFEFPSGNPLLFKNLLNALSLMHALGIHLFELRDAVAECEVEVKGRFNIIPLEDITLVDDTYNANPTSFLSVVRSLRKTYAKQRLVVVAGKMAELGEQSASMHRQLAKELHQEGVAHLMVLGQEDAKHYEKGWCSVAVEDDSLTVADSVEELVESFKKIRKAGDVVLVKGSRSAHMERFVDAIV